MKWTIASHEGIERRIKSLEEQLVELNRKLNELDNLTYIFQNINQNTFDLLTKYLGIKKVITDAIPERTFYRKAGKSKPKQEGQNK